MKFVLVLIVMLSIGVLYVWPYVSKEKACYEKTEASIEDIQFSVPARGVSLEEVCERQAVVIEDLDECIKKATGSATFSKQFRPIISGIVNLIRPLTKGLDFYISEHNEECFEFDKFQLIHL